MNQIICSSSCNLDIDDNNIFDHESNQIDDSSFFNNENIHRKKFFKMQFVILIIILVSTFMYYLYFRYDLYTSEKLAKNIKNNFEITKIYGNNSDYNVTHLNTESTDNSFSIIGIIDINKLNISYPKINDINQDLLKISPSRFYGPMTNEVGNLCIAAHNYKNDTFFSNISKLKIGDIIDIYDNNRKTYKIFCL